MSVLEKLKTKQKNTKLSINFFLVLLLLFSTTTLNACVKLCNMSSTPDSPSKPIPDTFFHLISQGRCFRFLMSNGLLTVSLSGSALHASEHSLSQTQVLQRTHGHPQEAEKSRLFGMLAGSK